jgi:catechol 2,3-dioxygenase-like lactoylglutathione lyase family enzyme
MLNRPATPYWGVVLDCADPQRLGEFYARLLGWKITNSEPKWVVIHPGDGVAYMAFQYSEGYVPPVWPNAGGQQQMMMHLDLEVASVQTAVAEAIEAGATLAGHQPQEKVRVMLDPAGHPFCLYADENE